MAEVSLGEGSMPTELVSPMIAYLLLLVVHLSATHARKVGLNRSFKHSYGLMLLLWLVVAMTDEVLPNIQLAQFLLPWPLLLLWVAITVGIMLRWVAIYKRGIRRSYANALVAKQ